MIKSRSVSVDRSEHATVMTSWTRHSDQNITMAPAVQLTKRHGQALPCRDGGFRAGLAGGKGAERGGRGNQGMTTSRTGTAVVRVAT